VRRAGLALLGLVAGLLAAEAPAAPLSLNDVLDSVERHPKLIAAEAALAAADGEALAAEGAFDPTVGGFFGGRPLGYYDQLVAGASLEWDSPLWGLGVEGGWRRGVGDFATYEGKDETTPGGELFVALSVPLLKDGPMDEERAERLAARARRDGASARRDARWLDLIAEAEGAYWSWAAKARRLAISEEMLGLATTRAAGLQRSIDEGAVAPVDALEAQRAVLSRQAKLEAARAKERAAAAKLALYLRDPAGVPIVASADQAPTLPTLVAERRLTVDEAAELAWERRPEGVAWRAAQREADASVRLARAQVLPKVDLKVGASADLPPFQGASTSLTAPTLDARLDLEWPTLMREGRGKLAASRGKADKVAADAIYVRDQLAAEVRSLAAALDAAEARLALAEQAVEVAAALTAAEESRFELGDSDLLIVNLREQSLGMSRKALAEVRAEVLALRASWRALVGSGTLGE